MKKTFITSFIFYFFCGVLSSNASAQEYKYDINTYYTPDIIRNRLDLNFNTDGAISNKQSKFVNSPTPNDTLNSNNLDGQLNSSFELFKNTRKRESLLLLSLNLSGQFDNKNDNKLGNYSFSKEHNSIYSEGIGLNYTNKFYNSTYQFLSIGISSNLNSSNSSYKKEITGSTTKNTGKGLQAQISPFFGIGTGRIESVKDARQAIYILDDLSKRGVLSRHLSDDEIFRLSQVISQVKNKRFLDARLHKIDEISTVDSFFVKNNLLTKSDATYFTTLYDIWENGANFERNSGQSFEIRLSPFTSWNYGKSQSEVSNPSSNYWQKQNENNYGASLAFNYSYAKQIGLNWEKNANVSLTGNTGRYERKYSTDVNSEFNYKQNVNNIALNGSFSIGYYPSTRTHLSASLSQSFAKTFNDLIIENSWHNYFFSRTNLGFSAVYYVSPQLSLSGNTSIYNDYGKNTYPNVNDHTNQLAGNFSIALKYSFF
jgi:hypothetical protein